MRILMAALMVSWVTLPGTVPVEGVAEAPAAWRAPPEISPRKRGGWSEGETSPYLHY